jgi:hypothetical protein
MIDVSHVSDTRWLLEGNRPQSTDTLFSITSLPARVAKLADARDLKYCPAVLYQFGNSCKLLQARGVALPHMQTDTSRSRLALATVSATVLTVHISFVATKVEMATRKELDTLQSTYLAVLCQRVADVSHIPDSTTAAKALALKVEWVALQSPPSISLKKEEKAKDAKRQDLRTRMLDFLEGLDVVD